MGWRFSGSIPKLAKAVVIIAPHTSNMDFFLLVLAKFSLQIKASYIMKQEAFFWPFKRWLIGIGGIPIDRSQPTRVVNQVIREIREHDRIWIVITPEGTRKKVHKYKTGFLRIAHGAEVPVVVVGLDYERKAVVFDKTVNTSGNHDTQANELYHYCRDTFVGRRPDYQ